MRRVAGLAALVLAVVTTLIFAELVSTADPHFWLPGGFALLLTAVLASCSRSATPAFVFWLWLGESSVCASAWALGSQGSPGPPGNHVIKLLVIGGAMVAVIAILGCLLSALRSGVRKAASELWTLAVVIPSSLEMLICGRALRVHSTAMQLTTTRRIIPAAITSADWFRPAVLTLCCFLATVLALRAAISDKQDRASQVIGALLVVGSFLFAQGASQVLTSGIQPLPLAASAIIALAATFAIAGNNPNSHPPSPKVQ